MSVTGLDLCLGKTLLGARVAVGLEPGKMPEQRTLRQGAFLPIPLSTPQGPQEGWALKTCTCEWAEPLQHAVDLST